MIQKIPIDIEKTYITKALDHKTFSILAKDKNYRIAEKIYCIANNIKQTNHFMEITDRDDVRLHATVRIYPSFAGDAKLQADTMSFIKKNMVLTPYYIIRCRLYTTRTYSDIFNIEHKTASSDSVYEIIHKLEKQVGEFL